MRLINVCLVLNVILWNVCGVEAKENHVPDVLTVTESADGHLTVVEFEAYRYEQKYCRFEKLIFVKDKNKTDNRVFDRYIRERGNLKCTALKENYVKFSSPFEDIAGSFEEAKNLLNRYENECDTSKQLPFSCLNFRKYALKAIEGPKINSDYFCYVYDMEPEKSLELTRLTLCSDGREISSAKIEEFMH